MTSYTMSSEMPFTERDGRLIIINKIIIKVFQKEKHDTARQLLEEFVNRNKTKTILHKSAQPILPMA